MEFCYDDLNWLSRIPYLDDGRDEKQGLDCKGLFLFLYRHYLGLEFPEDPAVTRVLFRKLSNDEKPKWPDVGYIYYSGLRFGHHIVVVVDKQYCLHSSTSSEGVSLTYWKKPPPLGVGGMIRGFYRLRALD